MDDFINYKSYIGVKNIVDKFKKEEQKILSKETDVFRLLYMLVGIMNDEFLVPRILYGAEYTLEDKKNFMEELLMCTEEQLFIKDEKGVIIGIDG